MFDFEAELRASFTQKAIPKGKKKSRLKPGTGEGTWNVDEEARESHKLSIKEKREKYEEKLRSVKDVLISICTEGATLRTLDLYRKLTFDISYSAVCKLFHEYLRYLCSRDQALRINNYSYKILKQQNNGTKL